MSTFELLQQKLDSNHEEHHTQTISAADSARHLLSENAFDLREHSSTANAESLIAGQPQIAEKHNPETHNSETLPEMASRLVISTGSAYVTSLALHVGQVHRIPKIGTPLAIATPFLVSGMVSSYEKSHTFTDPRAFAEGVFTYGAVHGGNRIASEAKEYLSRPQRLSQSIPLR